MGRAAEQRCILRTLSLFSTQWLVPLPSASSWRSHPAGGQSWLLKGETGPLQALRDETARTLDQGIRGWMLFDVEHLECVPRTRRSGSRAQLESDGLGNSPLITSVEVVHRPAR